MQSDSLPRGRAKNPTPLFSRLLRLAREGLGCMHILCSRACSGKNNSGGGGFEGASQCNNLPGGYLNHHLPNFCINHPEIDANLKKPFMRYFLWVYMKTAGSAVESGAGDLPHDEYAIYYNILHTFI